MACRDLSIPLNGSIFGCDSASTGFDSQNCQLVFNKFSKLARSSILVDPGHLSIRLIFGLSSWLLIFTKQARFLFRISV